MGLWAAALALLGGVGAVAFAVAPMSGVGAVPVQQLIAQPLETAGITEQLEALAGQDMALHRHQISRAGDSVETLLRRLGVNDSATIQVLSRDESLRNALGGRAGRHAQARSNAQGQLIDLVLRYPNESADRGASHFNRLTVAPIEGRWSSRIEVAPMAIDTRLGSGSIRSTLFAATDDARIPENVASQLAEIFASEIDFHRELRRGDTFSVMYETYTADGEPVAWRQTSGKLLAAEFINAGQLHQAIWFDGGGGRGDYYDTQGRSRKRPFLASPLEFSRVTSGFSMRVHPVLQRMKAHLGVDYGAPTGTAVRVVADGVVEFAGTQRGYGNVVEVRHSGERSTLYAHLSRIDVKAGQRVEQGSTLGAVGATGMATGPHLHFEFRVAGVHQDPQSVAKAANQSALDAASLDVFAQVARSAKGHLALAQSLGGQRAAFE